MCPCEVPNGQHNYCCICELIGQNLFSSSVQFSFGSVEVESQLLESQSRHFRDSSNWRLDQSICRALMQIQGPCLTDLFPNRLNSQLPQFFSWKPDPLALATDASPTGLVSWLELCFPPFCLMNINIFTNISSVSPQSIIKPLGQETSTTREPDIVVNPNHSGSIEARHKCSL